MWQAVINTQCDRLHRIYGMNEQDTALLMREQEKKKRKQLMRRRRKRARGGELEEICEDYWAYHITFRWHDTHRRDSHMSKTTITFLREHTVLDTLTTATQHTSVYAHAPTFTCTCLAKLKLEYTLTLHQSSRHENRPHPHTTELTGPLNMQLTDDSLTGCRSTW